MSKYTPVIERFTPEQKRSLIASFQLDLIALFSAIQSDVVKLLEKAVEENKSPEAFIQEVRDLI